VTPALDHGPIIVQAAVPVRQTDSEDTLATRVLEQEHRILPLAVRWFLEGRLRVEGNRVLIEGPVAAPPALISPGEG
jgi:phosphoribosylglycinamide formyltransferase-1